MCLEDCRVNLSFVLKQKKTPQTQYRLVTLFIGSY